MTRVLYQIWNNVNEPANEGREGDADIADEAGGLWGDQDNDATTLRGRCGLSQPVNANLHMAGSAR